MAHVLYDFALSRKSLVRLALLALSLSFGVPQAQSAYAAASDQGANQYNWLAGGGG
jgi:hypothetical protein